MFRQDPNQFTSISVDAFDPENSNIDVLMLCEGVFFSWESMETLLQKCIVFTTCSFKLRRFCRQGSLSWSFSWWDEQGRTLGVTCGNMRKANGLGSIPIGSMYDVFTYIWMISIYGKCKGEFAIHASYGIWCPNFLLRDKFVSPENIPWHPNCQIVKLSELSKGKLIFEKYLIYYFFVCFLNLFCHVFAN